MAPVWEEVPWLWWRASISRQTPLWSELYELQKRTDSLTDALLLVLMLRDIMTPESLNSLLA